MDPELDQDSKKVWVFIYQALLKTQTLIKGSLELKIVINTGVCIFIFSNLVLKVLDYALAMTNRCILMYCYIGQSLFQYCNISANSQGSIWK